MVFLSCIVLELLWLEECIYTQTDTQMPPGRHCVPHALPCATVAGDRKGSSLNATIYVSKTVLKEGESIWNLLSCPHCYNKVKSQTLKLTHSSSKIELSKEPHTCTTLTRIQKHIWEPDTKFLAILFELTASFQLGQSL